MGRSFLAVVYLLVIFDMASLVFCAYEPVDECGFQQQYTAVHSLPEGGPVYGVQSIGQEVYVIRDSTSYTEVYNTHTLQHKRNLNIENLQGPYDMVQSRHAFKPTFLFIADWFDAVNLTKIRPSPPGVRPTGQAVNVERWSFLEQGYTSLGLAGSSFYTGANILVTSSVSQKVKEFTPDGSLVSEVTIKNISSPRQSIKVASDRYAVCHGYGPPPALHRVCLVDGNGETIKCYGGVQGSGVGQLNIPGRLELNENGCILVADTGNKRVVLLNKNLDYVRNLIDDGLDGPYRLYLDQRDNLLYVADNTVDASGIAVGGRVKVFKF